MPPSRCRSSCRAWKVWAIEMTSRWLALPCLGLLLAGCERLGGTGELLQPNSGGSMTVVNTTRKAYAQAAPNLDVQRRGEFSVGNAFFNSPWIVAPASAGARDGLGPLFNARSCDQCHNNDGRGAPPLKQGARPTAPA